MSTAGKDMRSMRASPGDRLAGGGKRSRRFPLRTVLTGGALALGLGLIFYPGGEDVPPETKPSTPSRESAPEPPALPVAEDIPVAPTEAAGAAAGESLADATGAEETTRAAAPLPEPESSDPLVRERLQELGADGVLSGFAEGDNLVQRMVALLDGGSRGEVLRKILPMKPPKAPFPVETVDGRLYMSEAGYDRYDPYVDAVMGLDTDALVSHFHRLRPLYEKAYAQLGLPAEDMDNALIRSLDRIIAAPVVEEPVALERDSVTYTFADPRLEALPGLQKQLLRMGPDNARRLQEKARALRAALLGEETP